MHLMTPIIKALLLSVLVSACSDNSSSPPPPVEEVPPAPPTIELTFSDAPVDLTGISAQFAENVAYGEGERNVLDIYMPDADQPTPLVIYIHGGAFTAGDKSVAHENFSDDIRSLLSSGVAYATLNYYLLDTEAIDETGVIRSLSDNARALQFMRYYAASFNIDSANVAVYGHSAGAGTGLWLGTHDDLADPDSDDPVLRQSTRINAVAALATQATYDIVRWEEVLADVLAPFAGILGGTDIVTVSQAVGQTDLLLSFLAMTDLSELDTPEIAEYRANIDMLALMDSGDAPIFVSNITPSPQNLVDLLFHHGLHARALAEQADAVGLHSVVYITDPVFGSEDPSGEDFISFMLRHIN